MSLATYTNGTPGNANVLTENSSGTVTGALSDYYCANTKFSDIYYADGFIYLLVRDVCEASNDNKNHSRGGVAKFNAEDLSFVGMYGWTDGDISSGTEYKHDDAFYGPCKIIAVRPNEIVIGDSGNSYTAAGDSVTRKRAVTFSLKDMKITDAVDVNADLFQ